ncbi:MAG TPA: PQQ-binding-like beta-propeller repeat protein [Pirellulales bacterium]|jgi:outer membrane protein assembly factor BamB|nr:PQQ-binding-like beta-propeller repeat protein [Pirellulales bacterium]
MIDLRQPAIRHIAFYLLGLSLMLVTAASDAEDWPQFRGPDGQGHSAESNLPIEWSESKNIAWKTPIPGLGWSSPVVANGKVWLTSGDEAGGSLRAIAVDCRSGKVLHDVEVVHKSDLGRISFKNSHASPTPVIDGDRVYVHFGAHGTACLTTDGKILWTTELPYDHRHGPGGSPVVWNDLLIVACDGADQQYIVALDKTSGEPRWKQARSGEMAYSTPLVVRVGSSDQVVAVGGGAAVAYQPETGDEVWRCRFEGHSVVPRPVCAGSLLFFCTGYWTPSLYALRTDGKGDVTETHVVGRIHRSVPLTTSPLIIDDLLYMVNDLGTLTCVDARQGAERWHKRLGGNFSASPVSADGRLYLLNEDATTSVLAAGKEYALVATNRLEGRALASPAISNGAIYLRTEEHLYKIAARDSSLDRQQAATPASRSSSRTAQAKVE